MIGMHAQIIIMMFSIIFLAGEDFVPITNRLLVFTNTRTSLTISVGILKDDVNEGDEEFSVSLSDPTQMMTTKRQSDSDRVDVSIEIPFLKIKISTFNGCMHAIH